MSLISEDTKIKYRVMLNGNILTEAPSKPLAEQFVMTLAESQRQKVQIVPIVEGGQQVLLG